MSEKRPGTNGIKILERAGSLLAAGSGAVSALFLAGMTAVTLLGVFFRYVVQDPFQWTEELARFLMLWSGFLAMNVAMHHGQHLNIDIIVRILPRWISKILGYISLLLIGYFLVVLTTKGYSMTAKTMMQASSMKFSMSWIYMAVPLGAALTLVQVVLQFSAKVLGEFTLQNAAPSESDGAEE
jgi:TRAP-type C4-dicarboxylate transport system permease small subunit